MKQSTETEQRIDLLKTALVGANKEVYDWAAKFIHSEAVISMLPLPCCTPLSYVVPSPAKTAAKIKTPFWMPVKSFPIVTKTTNLIGKHVAAGAHVQFRKKPTSKTLHEGIVCATLTVGCSILCDGGITVTIPYEQIVNLDAHNPGKAAKS